MPFLFLLLLQETTDVQNRKENVQLIVSINAKGQPVYVDGVPALLNSSLSRLKNILKGQVLHTTEEAYSACIAVHPQTTLIEQNYALSDNLREAYRSLNQRYLNGDSNLEIEQWATDFTHSIFHKLTFPTQSNFHPGFISRVHVAEYFGMQAPEEATVGQGFYTEEFFVLNGYVLELTEWETLSFRKGGSTCARLRHRTWRHTSIPKQAPTVLSVDHSVSSASAAARSRADNQKRGEGRYYRDAVAHTVGINIDAPHQRNDIDDLTGLRKPVWRVA